MKVIAAFTFVVLGILAIEESEQFLQPGYFREQIELHHNETLLQLEKRGHHEEAPLFNLFDSSELGYYCTESYYPSRM